MRALVTPKEAGVIIGPSGQHVAALREKIGVKAAISKVVPRVHRVLAVSGSIEAVTNAFEMIVKSFMDHHVLGDSDLLSLAAPAPAAADQGSSSLVASDEIDDQNEKSHSVVSLGVQVVPPLSSGSAASDHLVAPFGTVPPTTGINCNNASIDSATTTVRVILSHNLMGAVIGKQGSTIKTIQAASCTRMVASKDMLPNSSERVIDIIGSTSNIHRAMMDVARLSASETTRSSGTILYEPD